MPLGFSIVEQEVTTANKANPEIAIKDFFIEIPPL
jgi:hypothetical protein